MEVGRGRPDTSVWKCFPHKWESCEVRFITSLGRQPWSQRPVEPSVRWASMKTIFGRKSLPAIKNQESVDTVCCFNEGLSRYWRNLRGRFQPGLATHHGSSLDCRGSSRETKTLQSSRNLP